MTASIRRRLILLAGVGWLVACGTKPIGEPPPQTAGQVPTSADAGLPPVPLTRRGVVMPSDVKLEPAANRLSPTNEPALTGAVANPNGY